MLLSIAGGEYKGSDAVKAKFRAALGLDHEFGNPAWPLPNLELSSEKEFWGWRASQGFKAEAWCGHYTVFGEPATLLIYWLDNSFYANGGFAVAVIYRGTVADEARYFSWRTCVHDFNHQRTGNCQYKYTCTKCGVSYDVDSSG